MYPSDPYYIILGNNYWHWVRYSIDRRQRLDVLIRGESKERKTIETYIQFNSQKLFSLFNGRLEAQEDMPNKSQVTKVKTEYYATSYRGGWKYIECIIQYAPALSQSRRECKVNTAIYDQWQQTMEQSQMQDFVFGWKEI